MCQLFLYIPGLQWNSTIWNTDDVLSELRELPHWLHGELTSAVLKFRGFTMFKAVQSPQPSLPLHAVILHWSFSNFRRWPACSLSILWFILSKTWTSGFTSNMSSHYWVWTPTLVRYVCMYVCTRACQSRVMSWQQSVGSLPRLLIHHASWSVDLLFWVIAITLQKLGNTESDLLSVQVTAYLDNKIEVATLLEDSDTKTAALQKVSELEEALSYVRLHMPF